MKNKKIFLTIISVLVIVLSLGMLTACGGGEDTPVDPNTPTPSTGFSASRFAQAFSNFSTAKSVHQEITISADSTLVYSLDRIYTVNGEEISCKTTEKSLNENYLTENDMYVETSETVSVTKDKMVEGTPAGLKLSDKSFVADSIEYSGTAGNVSVTATVSDGSITDVLMITNEEALKVTNATVTLTLEANQPVGYKATYTTTDGNTVTVQYTVRF